MRFPIVTLTISVICTTLYAILGAMPEALLWHADESQRTWQWLSAHFVHISFEHLAWNLGALIVLGSIIEQTSHKVAGAALLVGIVGVNFYLAIFYNLEAYAGLSGTLNALLFTALYFTYQLRDYKLASVITLLLSIGKITFEQFYHVSLFSNLPWPSVPQAHLAGLLAGGILVGALEWHKRGLLNSEFVSFT